MAEFTPANLANGELTTSPTVLYTVPAGKVAMLRSCLFVNKTGANVTLTVTLDFGTGQRNFICPGMTLRGANKFDDNTSVMLPAGTILRAHASANSAVDYIISGVIS